MKDAVIVSTARTPIGLAFKGSLNNIKSPTLNAHAIRHAVDRAGVAPDAIDDVVIGSVLNAGTAGMNIARNASLAAGLPYSVAAQTIDRQCASGLMAVATAAKQIIVDGMENRCCRWPRQYFSSTKPVSAVGRRRDRSKCY